MLISVLMKTKLGANCHSFARLADFDANKMQVLAAQIAILDINLGPHEPSGLDAYKWLVNNNFTGKILFLTGHARSNPLVAEAANLGAEVMAKPLETEQLLSIVRKSFMQSEHKNGA